MSFIIFLFNIIKLLCAMPCNNNNKKRKEKNKIGNLVSVKNLCIIILIYICIVYKYNISNKYKWLEYQAFKYKG